MLLYIPGLFAPNPPPNENPPAGLGTSSFFSSIDIYIYIYNLQNCSFVTLHTWLISTKSTTK